MNKPVRRVGLVGPLPPPYGGMANQTRQLTNLLQQEGVQVVLVQVNAPYHFAWVSKIRGIRALFRLIPYLLRLWRVAGQVQLFHIMANSGWAWHLFAVPAIWIARFRSTPVIVNYRGGEAEVFFKKSFHWIRPSLNRTDAIIVPSGFLEAVFSRYGYTAGIVPNIIDLSRFQTRSSVHKADRGDSPHIVVTRNLEAIYDNATAIRAFYIIKQSMPAARLTVAGEGPEKAMLKTLVADLCLQDSVKFTGRISNDAIAALYQDADLMINASLVDNMPISILEALASGVPVVSTDAGGIPYLVEHHKTAMLVPMKDPDAMADAMLQILKNPELADSLRNSGLDLLERYTWNSVKLRLFDMYQQVLKHERH
ncbi:glycosyltransferase family 4 protein [Nitrosomonas marina]|uniref:Glycosyltransferase involved in cell wall bisynthesis n=1 Tax=Nitrosomonas marina TaxID=917 RepID=A0A1H8BSD6_9PROT|nr:glycosyltransferase family 4 protein [Nitrosomonas marina]SEM85713.1 Glycosyltransferase involved in cell wall bisynthesis [Nitrosomonas marina]